jgi:FkbM family methyltransferase
VITAGDYKFHVRDNDSDAAVIHETWTENVYQIEASDFGHTGLLVDIGANIGAVSLYAVSLGARALAVEPEVDNLNYLHRNLQENNAVGRVIVYPVAVSDFRGTGRITSAGGNSRLMLYQGTEVPVLDLGALLAVNGVEQCDVCKIDVEGSEYQIIGGASIPTLERIRYLTMEFHAVNDRTFGAMIAKLAKVFNSHIIGSPERGGYYYGRRYF